MQKMVKLLPFLFSLFIFGGCGAKYNVSVVAPPKIVIPQFNDENVTIKAIKKNGKIIISVDDFKKLSKKIIYMKQYIKTVNSIIKKYNSIDYNISKGAGNGKR